MNPIMERMGKQNRYKQANRDQGLCTDCSEPVVPGKKRCQRHLDYLSRYTRAWRKKGAFKVCDTCGHKLGPEDKGNRRHNRNSCCPSRRVRL